MEEQVGVIKEIDKLGRIVIPKAWRCRLGLQGEVEIVLIKEGVLVRNPKYAFIKAENIKEGETS